MEIRWIKLAADIFANRKIRQIESLPEGDAIVVIWIRLLCLAGETNDGGAVYFAPDIPFTDQMLATEMNRPLTTVQLALRTFEQFRMIERGTDGVILVKNWEKYQAVDRMREIKEYNRDRKRAYRARLAEASKETAGDNVRDMSGTSPRCPNTDIETEKEKEKEKERERSKERSACARGAPVDEIVALFNGICRSFSPVSSVEKWRIEKVGALWQTCPDLDTFREVFEIFEASDFLKGGGEKGWKASFDWLIKPDNFRKVMEHQYDERPKEPAKSGKVDADFWAALEAKYAKEDEDAKARGNADN